MLFVEFLGVLLGEPGHFDIADGEAVFFDKVEDFSGIHVAIGFDHGKGLAFLGLEFVSGELVSVVDDFELAGVNVEDGADEDIFELDVGVLSFFEKHFSGFEVKHFDGPVLAVVCEVVGPDEGSSRVVPLDYKHVAVVAVGHLNRNL